MNHPSKYLDSRLQRIDPNKSYNIAEIARKKLLKWKDRKMVRAVIHADFLGMNLLHTKITGEGTSKIYRVLGRHLINFINLTKNQSEKEKPKKEAIKKGKKTTN